MIGHNMLSVFLHLSWHPLLSVTDPPPPPPPPPPRFSAAPSLWFPWTLSTMFTLSSLTALTVSVTEPARASQWVAGCRPRRRFSESFPLGSPVAVTQSVSGPSRDWDVPPTWILLTISLLMRSLVSLSGIMFRAAVAGEGTDFFVFDFFSVENVTYCETMLR